MPIHVVNTNRMNHFLFFLFCFFLAPSAFAQLTFTSGEIDATTQRLTGDPATWAVVISFAERNEAANSFTLSKEALQQIKGFSSLHGKVREGKLLFAKLLKAGARVFAPEELKQATALAAAYDAGIREGNYTALTKSGETFLSALEKIRTAIEQQRNEDIDALIAEKSGDVNKRKGFLGEWKGANKGDLLAQADGLKTGAASSAQLAFTDGVEVMIDPNSTVVIRESTMDKLDNSVRRDIALMKGSLLTKLTESAKERNNFTFRAGTSEAQVKSGKFWASAIEERRVKVSNYDGTMDVAANNNAVRLRSNEGTVVEQGKDPLPPVQLLPSPRLAWSSIDSVIYSDYFQLQWSPVQQSAQYTVEVSPTKEFNTGVSVYNRTETSMRLERIALGSVYVRLTAVDRLGLRGVESPVYRLMRVEDKLPPAIYVDGWVTDRRYTALSSLTIKGNTEADARLTANGNSVQLDASGGFTITVPVGAQEVQQLLQSTDRSGNARERRLSIVPIDVKKVTAIEWNCPVKGDLLSPTTDMISARGTAYPSVKITARYGNQISTSQTDSQGNWAISVSPMKGGELVLVFESISDNIVITSKTYRIE